MSISLILFTFTFPFQHGHSRVNTTPIVSCVLRHRSTSRTHSFVVSMSPDKIRTNPQTLV
ncbi:hypothetical protein M6B38_118910 [Iris pallida]|uniref:Uncharacterized protein n=1 Tax=Iris pallida TaxID=29817 RepID=A0AAX6HJM1_IRIPA|nr:hypothetical protein M6B38_118910 [Iris pallida]